MKVIVSIICIFGIFGIIQAGTIVRQIEYPEFEPIGTIGNKTFFTHVNKTLNVSWYAAKDICKGIGLEFAILKNDAEFDFVRAALPMSAKLWIDTSVKGTDYSVDVRSAFINGDGSNFITKNIVMTHFVCLYFSGDDHIFSDMCWEGRRGVLCQSAGGNNPNGTIFN